MITGIVASLCSILWLAPTKVFLLSGQSNMSGAGHVSEIGSWKNPSNIKVYFANNGSPDLKGPVVLAPGKANEDATTFGPEIGIADILGKQYPNDKIVFVKLAWGATCLQGGSNELVWLDGTLYTKWFLPKLKSAISLLSNKSVYPEGFQIAGIFWMQGESDASDFTKSMSGNYSSALKKFVEERLRTELAKATSVGSYSRIPFVYSLIRSHWPYAGKIQEEMRVAQYQIPGSKCTQVGKTAEVYTSWTEQQNNAGFNSNHYDAVGSLAVGHSMGDAMVQLLRGDNSYGCPSLSGKIQKMIDN